MNQISAESSPAKSVRLAGWLAMPEPLVVEIMGRAGFDWVGFDLQHGSWDLGTAFRGIQLIDLMGQPVIVRVADEELPLIPRVLDQGASGIVLAMASEPEIVAAAVSRARYQPNGRRSYGGQRYGLRTEPKDLNDLKPAIFPMIETRRGIEAIDEIASIPGIAGLHVGPTDLALGLGVGRDQSAAAFITAIEKILVAGHSNDLPVVMHAVSLSQVHALVAAGFDELVLTADIEVLRSGMLALVSGARGLVGGN